VNTETSSTHDRLQKLSIPRKPRARKRKSKSLVFGTFLIVVTASLFGGYRFLSGSDWFESSTEVRTAFVQVDSQSLLSANGYLESRRQAKVGAKVAGLVKEVMVEEGQKVEKGSIMVVLEHADLDASLNAMGATLEQARADLQLAEENLQQYERQLVHSKELYRKGFLSSEQYEQQKSLKRTQEITCGARRAAIVAAEARVNEAKQHRMNMFVRAPFSGTVITRDAEVGETITPGGMGQASGRGSVATLADLAHLEVDTDVKEDFISRIIIGQPAEVAVDSVPDRRYQGTLRQIIPMGDRARGTIKVKVAILDADEKLFPEMSATVHFLPEKEEGESEAKASTIYIQEAAIVSSEGGSSFVWQVKQGRVQRVGVELGPLKEGQYPVINGLSGGEKVVLDPPEELTENTLISEPS